MLRPIPPFLALLAACSGGPSVTPAPPIGGPPAARPTGPAPSWAGDTLDRPGAGAVIQLDRRTAEWNLSAPGAATPDLPTSFTITDWTSHRSDDGAWYSAPAPFPVPENLKKFAPDGVKVRIDGVEANFFTSDPAAPGAPKPGWRLMDDRVIVTSATAPKRVQIDHPNLHRGARRLIWPLAQADGLTADAFAHYTHTTRSQSREGLLLPAPASGTWADVQIPEGARFEAHLAMVPTSVGASDGAVAVLRVIEAGATTEVARQPVSAGEGWTRWTADLSAFAGRTVSVQLATESGKDAANDAVTIGSPTIIGASGHKPRHVFVIGIDTLRPDHLSANGYPRPTTPELDAWAKDAVIFDNAWTSAPRTRPSFRAATTGRLPLDAVCAPNIGEVFDQNGWATAGIVSNIHLNTKFDFQRGFDFWWLDGKALVDDQIARAQEWLAENQERDTYMFLHIMDPHIFYRAPDAYADQFSAGLPPLPAEEKLPPRFNRWQVYKWAKTDKLSDLRKQHIVAAYDAELAWTSSELKKLLDAIDKLPGDSLVIIHNDHGEEFWEHNGYEHNHTLYDDVTRGLMWIKPPGGTGGAGARSEVPATLQDIAPTAYAFAGITDHPEVDGISLLPAVRGEAEDGWTRPIPIGHLQYDASRWGVVWQGKKYILMSGNGAEELYDLASDPGERTNLADQQDTTEFWKKLGEAHEMPVGRGWRVTVKLPDSGGPYTIHLPKVARAADVLDPELITQHPANQEWGEAPKKRPSDVATVKLAADGRSVEVTAGPKGDGVLYILFDDDAPPTRELRVTDASGEAKPDGKNTARLSGASFQFRPGIVFVAPPGEHVRMMQCGGGDVGQDTMNELKELGYVH